MQVVKYLRKSMLRKYFSQTCTSLRNRPADVTAKGSCCRGCRAWPSFVSKLFLSSVLVGLDLAEGEEEGGKEGGGCWEKEVLCVAHCPQIFLLLPLRIHSLLLSIFHGFCLFDPSVVILHIIPCRRFSFFRHRVPCSCFPCDAILIANLHFILL